MAARLSAEHKQESHVSAYSPPLVDRIWGIWRSYYAIPKAVFYLFKGDYRRAVGTSLSPPL